ncbi:hypothetical protein L2E82_42507 [Cichorium intybus]|uniref:Uncharacterized protein n=1 Tax=Cichorium intybus TaxID=13427 RepID=A0ACB8ZN19_CICIN|nr:hypothetical protein L2E82_42507 [Cichorium intybus]
MMETKRRRRRKASVLQQLGSNSGLELQNGLDYVLMSTGIIGAFVHGCSLLIFLKFFADLDNSFGSNANNIDKMSQEVLKYTFYFLVVRSAIWASSWAGLYPTFMNSTTKSGFIS